jgi:ABC-type polysaccharide/polyol phosphate export permease
MFAVSRLFHELYQFRELLLALTLRDIRVKYKQAVLGVLWGFFVPGLVVLSGVLIRLAMAKIRGGTVSIEEIGSLMIRSLPWILFMNAVSAASTSLTGNTSLVTKIYFPREVIPTASLLSSLVDFTMAVVMVVGFLLLWPDSPIVWSWALLWVPLCMGLIIVLVAAVGYVLAAANLFFRDVKYIVQLVLRFGIFFTPVYLGLQEIGFDSLTARVLLLNPLSAPMEMMAEAVLKGHVNPALYVWLAYSAVWSIGGFIVAAMLFEEAEHLFAEYV